MKMNFVNKYTGNKLTLSAVTLLVTVSCFAQDNDIPTYHTKRESFSKIVEPEIRKDLASFTLGGLDEGVGKQPLAFIPATEYADNYVLFTDRNVQIKITAVRFDKNKHKLLLYDEGKYVIKIDNKPYWGIDGKTPLKEIQSIVVVIGRDTVVIPAAAYNDLFEPKFCNTLNGKTKCNAAVYLSPDQKRIYIYMLNSDGKNGYEVTWILQDKKYLKRVIDYGF